MTTFYRATPEGAPEEPGIEVEHGTSFPLPDGVRFVAQLSHADAENCAWCDIVRSSGLAPYQEPTSDGEQRMGVLRVLPGRKPSPSEWAEASSLLREIADRCDRGEVNAIGIIAILPDLSASCNWRTRTAGQVVPLLGGVEAFRVSVLGGCNIVSKPTS
jgi:hypothetical protein